ncbi:hypothetical protein ACFL0L_04865 [Patescibacteria group bacterium]
MSHQDQARTATPREAFTTRITELIPRIAERMRDEQCEFIAHEVSDTYLAERLFSTLVFRPSPPPTETCNEGKCC